MLKALGHGLNGLGLWPALKGRWILYLDDGLDSMTDDLEWGLHEKSKPGSSCY